MDRRPAGSRPRAKVEDKIDGRPHTAGGVFHPEARIIERRDGTEGSQEAPARGQLVVHRARLQRGDVDVASDARPAFLRDDERDVPHLLPAGTDEQPLRVHPQERFARLIDEVRIPVQTPRDRRCQGSPGRTRGYPLLRQMIHQAEVLDSGDITPALPQQAHNEWRLARELGAHRARDRTEGCGLRLLLADRLEHSQTSAAP